MEKQTKLLLGLGLIGAGGYMLWKQSQKPATASFATYGGRRQRFTGKQFSGKQNMGGKKNMAMMAGGTVEAHQSTFNANGSSDSFSHGGFFDVKGSGWLRGFAGGPTFYDVKDSSWM